MKLEISNVAKMPTAYATFNIQSFKEGHKEHLVVFTDDLKSSPIVRIHSECLTGDAFASLKCDCGPQLDYALALIAKEGGMIIYLRQEGRNIGLLNKVNAYALQDQGMDTIEANHQLGFSADERSYEIVQTILDYYKIPSIQLLTNNPNKVDALAGISIEKRIPIIIDPNQHNQSYLAIKKNKMGHLI